MRLGRRLHVAVKLLLAVLRAIILALECAEALKTLARLAHVDFALAHTLDESGFLDLLLEALLQAVIGLFAFLVCVDCHKCGDTTEKRGATQEIQECLFLWGYIGF